MHHVHSRTVTSNVTTNNPVSSLSPATLFPFFQRPSTPFSSASTASASSTSSSPSSSYSSAASSPSAAAGHTSCTSTRDDSSCPCHSLDELPTSAIGHTTFVTLPSINSHQPLVLPLPQPPAPPLVSSPPFASASASGPDTANKPLLVFTHGSTQVDTFVPSLRRMQHTLYTWSQLSDYTPKRCWELPASSSSTSHSTAANTNSSGAHNMSISKAVGRQCQEQDLASCPGHPWVNFSYHMQVKQWQEAVSDDTIIISDEAIDTDKKSVERCPHNSEASGPTSGGDSGFNVRLSAPCGALCRRRRQRKTRQLRQHNNKYQSGTVDNKTDNSSSAADNDSVELEAEPMTEEVNDSKDMDM